jgi:ABC-type multidrug transport system fused ATPase/permease subunit
MWQDARKLAYVFTRRERRNAAILLVLMVVGALLDVAGVGAIPAFVSMLSQPERILRIATVRRVFEALGATDAERRVFWAATGLVVIFVVKNAYLTVFSYLQARYIYNRQVSLSGRLFRSYLHSPYTFHLGRNTASILHNTTFGAFSVVGDLMLPSLRLLMETLVLAAVLVLLVSMEPLLSAAMVLLIGGTVALFMLVVRKRLALYGHDEHEHRSQMMLAVNQGLGGIKDVKVLGRERHFLREFEIHATGYSRAGRYRYIVHELPRLFLETVAVLTMAVVTGVFLYEGRSIQSIVPALTLLAVAALRLIPSANRIVLALIGLRFGHATLDAIYADLKLLDISELDETTGRAGERLPFDDAIEFDEVTYRYPGASVDALSGVSARISKGTSVGIIGPSGAGKTTAIDILLGLLRPQHGFVRVDGADIGENLAAWRRLIGYIPQHIFLLDDTVRRNIAFGIPDEEIDDERVWAAIDAAQLHDLITGSPEGLRMIVGERGVRLSGGERQRLGIARALYHNPPVLVMDEATSALDNETERDVVRALECLRGSRTLVIIAHRLSTVAACDQLLYIKDGHLIGSGSYEELRESNRHFFAMTA